MNSAREVLSNLLESEDEEKHKAFIRFLDAQKEAMEVHKWIESEKAGHDLGDFAKQDWVKKYAAQFREEWEKTHGPVAF